MDASLEVIDFLLVVSIFELGFLGFFINFFCFETLVLVFVRLNTEIIIF